MIPSRGSHSLFDMKGTINEADVDISPHRGFGCRWLHRSHRNRIKRGTHNPRHR